MLLKFHILSQTEQMQTVLIVFTFSGSLSYVRNSVEINVTSGISLLSSYFHQVEAKVIESIDSIRKYAPQIYTTQNKF